MAQAKLSQVPAFSTHHSYRFGILRYPDRWSELLELRRAAYGPESNVAPLRGSEMHDPRDDRATVIIAELNGRIVASLRLTPSLETGPILDHTGHFAKPVRGLPDPSEYLEVSRGCVAPEHRGQGLFWQLAARMVLMGQELGRRFLVGGVRPHLWPYWRTCGFKKIGAAYRLADGAEIQVMTLCIEEALAGSSIEEKFARVLLPLARACTPENDSMYYSAYNSPYYSTRDSASAHLQHGSRTSIETLPI